MKENQKSVLGSPEFKTNIEPLDRMLGYNEDLGHGTGIRPGDIIVLRGGPGSGKTTLGLQIMSRYLESEDCRYAGDKLAAVFLSLESEPLPIFSKVKECFGFFKEHKQHFYGVPARGIQYLLRGLKDDTATGSLADEQLTPFVEAFIKTVVGPAHEIATPVARLLIRLLSPIAKTTYPDQPAQKTEQDASERRSDGDGRELDSVEGILFIDSLNAFLAMLHQHLRMDPWEPRLALKSALECIRSKCARFVILASSEFHHGISWAPMRMAESFFSDVEILLASEPIAVPEGYHAERPGFVGYDIFKIIRTTEGEEITRLESRPFVRVLKSRKGANQARRCAYDIVADVGVEFYETYPGDGHIALFRENSAQHEIWDTLFNKDIPQLYPALRCEDFDRSSLQRTFMNQRRFRYVPTRTDMYISSFDNYWINWYGELCWRRAIKEALQEHMTPNDGNNPGITAIASKLHTVLTGSVPEFDAVLAKVKADEETKTQIKVAFAALLRNNNCSDCIACRLYWYLFEAKMTPGSSDFKSALNLVRRDHGDMSCSQNNNPADEVARLLPNPTQDDLALLESARNQADRCCAISPVGALFTGQTKDSASKNSETASGYRVESAHAKKLITEDRIKEKADVIFGILTGESGAKTGEIYEEVKRMEEYFIRASTRDTLAEELLRCPQDKNLKSAVEELLRDATECMCKSLVRNRLSQSQCNSIRSNVDGILKGLFTTLARVLFGVKGAGSTDTGTVVTEWMESTGNKSRCESACSLIQVYRLALQKINKYHLLNHIPDNKLRLFGERRSNIIREMEEVHTEGKRPLHRPDLIFSVRDSASFVSIPYDANVSFMTYRHDLLHGFAQETLKQPRQYVETILSLYQDQQKLLDSKLIPRLTKTRRNRIERFVLRNLQQYVERERVSAGPAKTWEEFIALSRLLNHRCTEATGRKSHSRLHYVIETQTFDTLLCTILEMLWSCGGNLRILPDYSVQEGRPGETAAKLSQAFYLLGIMLNDGLIAEDSTLRIDHFANSYTRASDTTSTNNRPDWVFARQWYSTFVELMATQRKKWGSSDSGRAGLEEPAFLWQNPKAEIGVMSMPFALSEYVKPGGGEKHVSCWGDWHLIMTKGSENTELGIDLINNLMSSQKITERAFHSAAVPAVEEFYELYGDSRCFGLHERRYYSPQMLPNMSFNDLRKQFFSNARSRSEIFDYEHCMLQLHSLFQFIKALAAQHDPSWDLIGKKVEDTLNGIRRLNAKAMLEH
jgi:hypothetical protein